MRFEYEQPFVGEARCVTRQERLRVSGHSLFKDPLFSLYRLSRALIETKTKEWFIDRKRKEVGVGKGGNRRLWTALKATATYFYQKSSRRKRPVLKVPK